LTDCHHVSDPDMVAAQLVEQEYIQALGKHILITKQVILKNLGTEQLPQTLEF